ncbi:hypothetical protein C8E03_102304 [Lachnotalea glycerini]|uniref:DUF2802 domain-containing protein n=1 Tax=Lachnotalea glycerini TaxID=1763509 RepID=A0A318ERE2_9FIRM|nr:DUF6115 domain-containing protein [Lachnotalea glycerini]PXV93536.1 hypothetical protein C8E03_102304 [Lachnotalea glycerini]
MTAFDIVIIIIGLIIFICSFFVSEKVTVGSEQLKASIDENEIKKLINQQIHNMSDEINETISEAIDNSIEGVKRSMEKLSNEKIMAINEYSDTVMDSIHKNHNEVMFLYGMLNDKNKEIRETAELITKANKGISKKITDAFAVTEKMDKQMAEINIFATNQKESIDKLAKSASTIEILEEQIRNIELMALQFSNDMTNEEKNRSMKKLANDEESSLGISELDDIETNLVNLVADKNFENGKNRYEIDIENSDEDIEGILENISNDTTVENIKDTENASNYNSKILEMSQSGYTSLEIARTLGLGVGEVQLVIDLFEGGRR